MPPEVPGHEFKQSWIEIELVDDEGRPVVGETCEVIGPDGKLLCRRPTGADGRVHVLVDDTGTCQISFPNLDSAVWERI